MRYFTGERDHTLVSVCGEVEAIVERIVARSMTFDSLGRCPANSYC
jgi:hypothetical protein